MGSATTECILVVEDDAAIRDTLVEILNERGCQAVGAANGRQAIDILEQQSGESRTCLIILDLMMPVMDGRTFREEQLKRDRIADIPVVVISAATDATRVGRAMNAVETLPKPIQVADVMRIASRFCECDAESA